jgi:serine phosphatase RsbU (regulator of sigma subunit)
VSNEELQNDGCDAAFVQIDCDVGTLTYAGANIDLIWIPRGGELRRLHGDSVGLGYRGADPDQFTEQTLAFETGDRFLITTDGYVDQVSGSNQKGRRRGFGYQRLVQLLRHNRERSLAENMQILRDSLISWQGEGLRRDDITVIYAQLKR